MMQKIKILLKDLLLKIKFKLNFLKKRKKKNKENLDDIYPLF